jgi:hypothetical protein
MDEAAPAGCVIRTRIIGAIEAEEPRMARRGFGTIAL